MGNQISTDGFGGVPLVKGWLSCPVDGGAMKAISWFEEEMQRWKRAKESRILKGF